jgi:ribosome-associated heat shock protein Hsp15
MTGATGLPHQRAADPDDDDEHEGEGEPGPADARPAAGASGSQRLDKWLWFARVAKSRTLAAALVAGGKVRVNRVRVDKPAHNLKPGDVVTISVGPRVRVLEVLQPGVRRGPATEARGLFDELTPRPDRTLLAGGDATSGAPASRPAERPHGAGRPTKRERRQIDSLKGRR